ncbi:fibrinogen-binding adhesin SdrG C-terminal domain-containing protein, partial [Staphylococcus epidermidis]
NIDFGNIDSAYIIKVVSKFTPGAEESLSIQQAARMTTTDSYGYPQYSQYTNTVNSTSDSGGGDGTVAKTYKIGDYVWEDTDKD